MKSETIAFWQNVAQFITFGGALMAAIGAALSSYFGGKASELDKIEISDLNQRLLTETEYSKNYLTGGNSFPVLKAYFIASGGHSYKIECENKFETPVYNVRIQMYNFSEIVKHSQRTGSQFLISYFDQKEACIVDTTIPEISPQSTVEIHTMKFDYQQPNLFFVNIKTRSLKVEQKLYIGVSSTAIASIYKVNNKEYPIEWAIGEDRNPFVVEGISKQLSTIPFGISFKRRVE